MKTVLTLFLSLIVTCSFGQDKVYETFKSTRIINGHSTESLWKREMNFFLGHRFGDFTQGMSNMWNSTDVRIGVDYGVSNNLMAGFGLAKGAGPYRELADGYLKYKVLEQMTSGMPISVSLLATVSHTSMDASTDSTSAVSFTKWEHRMAYCFQALIAHKLNDRIAVQFMPTYVHRNYVAFEDENGLLSLGFAGKFQITKMFGITAEYYYLLNTNRVVGDITYRDPLSIGFEFDTGGHVFKIALTNSEGFGETQFIPHTMSSWNGGGYRFGFNLGRVFKI